MNRRELILGFIKANLKILTDEILPEALYRKKKREYFVERFANSKQGIPRDNEIAGELMWYLIRINAIRTEEDVLKFLLMGVLAGRIGDPQVYLDFVRTKKERPAVIDFTVAKKADFIESVREQIRQEVVSDNTFVQVIDIEEAIKNKIVEYESLPSVVDSRDYTEPIPQSNEIQTETFQYWWQQLNLSKDPFPVTEGLRRIDPSSYEAVVVKTPLFQRYLDTLKGAIEEIFKNTIFFGEFGSGKTTLFEYFSKAFSSAGIESLYVPLFPEKDLETTKIVFKEKMIQELSSILGTSEFEASSSSLESTENTLVHLIRKLLQQKKPKGLVVFIDDLHKRTAGLPVALDFLSYLQVFTYELVRRVSFDNLAFYVAGAREWEQIIRTQPRYSGSLARRESIPDITEEEAWVMLNKRLEAFYPNPEVKRAVDRVFVSQVYRDLKTNKLEPTFRNFIQRLVEEFKIGNFKVLTSDPVHIPPETLAKVKTMFEENGIVKERFQNLLQEKIQSQENRVRALRLLLSIYLKRGIKEDNYEDNPFYLQALARNRLIVKAKLNNEEFAWEACSELKERASAIATNFSFSLEDYLLKIYGMSPTRRRFSNEEIQELKNFIEICGDEDKASLADVLKLHQEILETQDTYTLTCTKLELAGKCKRSLETLTDFFVNDIESSTREEITKQGLSFWGDFWYSPEEISKFQELLANEDECERRIWYVVSIYRQAFNVLLGFISKEYRSLDSVHIDSFGLENNEIVQLVQARDFWTKGSADRSLSILYNSVQSSLRNFIQNCLTILYGDLPSRIKHLSLDMQTKVKEAMSNRQISSGSAIHEFSLLSFEDLGNLITDRDGMAESSLWEHVFSKVFQPLVREEIAAYFKKLSTLRNEYNEDSSGETKLDLRDLIFTSVDLTRGMNLAYSQLIQEGLHVEMASGEVKLYMSFDGLRDKSQLIPILFRSDELQQIIARLSGESIRLDDQRMIQEYFSASYRDSLAYLSLIVREVDDPLKIPVKFKVENVRGTKIYLKRILKFSGTKPPRLFLSHSSKDSAFARALAGDSERLWHSSLV